jgi:hypothetical protein
LADRQRQQKAIAQREALDRQAEEDKKLIMQKQKEQVAHEMQMLQRREAKLRELQ